MEKWLSLWSIGQQYGLREIEKIKKANFSGIEIWAEHHLAEESFEIANQCDLQIGLHLPFHDLNLGTPYKDIAVNACNIIKEWIETLSYYNGEHAVIHGGSAMASEDHESVYPEMIERLKEINDFAEEKEVELLFENQIPDKLNYMHIFPSSVDEWIDVLQKTNTKACLDVGHLAVQKDDFKNTVSKLGDLLKSIHLSDNDGQSDLHLLPGDGNVSSLNSIRDLEELGYNGPVVFEINPYKYSFEDILNHSSVINFDR